MLPLFDWDLLGARCENERARTQAFLAVVIKNLRRNPRRRKGAHTDAFLIVFMRKLVRIPRRREVAFTHVFPIIFIDKLIGNPRRREEAHTCIPYCFHMEIDKDSKEEGGSPHTHTHTLSLMFLIGKLIRNLRSSGKFSEPYHFEEGEVVPGFRR